jgi:hypothetical protein
MDGFTPLRSRERLDKAPETVPAGGAAGQSAGTVGPRQSHGEPDRCISSRGCSLTFVYAPRHNGLALACKVRTSTARLIRLNAEARKKAGHRIRDRLGGGTGRKVGMLPSGSKRRAAEAAGHSQNKTEYCARMTGMPSFSVRSRDVHPKEADRDSAHFFAYTGGHLRTAGDTSRLITY